MSSAWHHIHGFERLSLCDWPGKSSCVIFLGGCNMRCPTCHNWQLAWEAEKLPVLARKDIEAYLNARRTWLDGIVITGGEATRVSGLAALAADLKAYGLPLKIDSNGLCPDVLESLLREGLADAFSIDVKGPWRLYPRLSGGTTSPEEAQTSLERVFTLAREFPEAFMFRMTRVPILADADVAEARTYLPKGFTLKIQDFVPPRRAQHAEADSQTRRASGNVVDRPHSGSHSQGAEGQRHQGPTAL
ncbi:MAG TPA: anaerobic ribonucleoside-triphosphate reductase activating protein [Desulfovibrio sp.]|nr:anaerobic ribonucleoside-triphosphate reductase activating protein [Desulfovibrio sp.]